MYPKDILIKYQMRLVMLSSIHSCNTEILQCDEVATPAAEEPAKDKGDENRGRKEDQTGDKSTLERAVLHNQNQRNQAEPCEHGIVRERERTRQQKTCQGTGTSDFIGKETGHFKNLQFLCHARCEPYQFYVRLSLQPS